MNPKNTWVLFKSSLLAFKWDIGVVRKFCALEIPHGLKGQ